MFNASGRGRRPNLPVDTVVNNRLVVQFNILRTEADCPWGKLEEFMLKMLPQYYPQRKFRGLVIKTMTTLQCKLGSDDELVQVFLNTVLDLGHVGPHLHAVGIGRQELSAVASLRAVTVPILTNGMVTEMELFRRTEMLPHSELTQWINILLPTPITTSQLRKEVRQTFDDMKKKQRNKGRDSGQRDFDEFQAAGFLPDASNACCVHPVEAVELVDEIPPPCHSSSGSNSSKNLELLHKDAHIRCLDGQIEAGAKERRELKDVVAVLTESIAFSKTTIANLQLDVAKRDCELDRLKTVLCVKEEEIVQLKEAQEVTHSIKQSAYYQRLKRREEDVADKQRIIEQHRDGDCERQHLELKVKIKNLQTQLSHFKKSVEVTQAKFRCLKREMSEESSIMDESESPRLQTKVDGSNKFTPDVIRCVMELIGEAEVPGTRCGRVMKIVVRHLFSQDMPLTEFPSERTALRMSDCGHALAKNQVGEALVHSKGYDLHSDGTDRDHNKVVGHQVTTKEQGTLGIGFVGVQTENTDTLLDVAVNLLKELAYVYDEEEIEKSYKAMLSNMTGVMSDRASVMKSFGRKLNETRQKELGQTETDNLEFLHCNAHFLLGLSTASEKTLSSIEKEIGEDLGRDKLTQFATRFRGSSENSTSRYIRTACDCLGPRGDEKSGCRDAWEAFCDMTDRRSCVSSYRSNRFNNYFQAGAALHYHREDINQFFDNYL